MLEFLPCPAINCGNVELARIKAVTFDAGGTLMQPWPSVGHVYSAVAAELGYGSVSPEELNEAFAMAWNLKQQFDYSLSAWFGLVEEVFGKHLSSPLSQKLFDSLYERFRAGAAWRVYDDVRPTLEALHQRGYRMAVISNWDHRLKPLLADLQLSEYFEAIVLSVDVGATKPAAKVFEHTLSLLKLPPPAVLYIGDSLEEDLIGPRQCGMAALLLDRQRKTEERLSSLTDLLPLLRGPANEH